MNSLSAGKYIFINMIQHDCDAKSRSEAQPKELFLGVTATTLFQ